MNENSHLNQKLLIFGKEKPTVYGVLFPPNSPIQPLYNKAVALLKENGAEYRLLNEFEGKDINQVINIHCD